MKLIKNNVIKITEEPVGQAGNLRYMRHYYRDNTTAMFNHMSNMIETYGKKQVAAVIRDLLENGVLDGKE